MIVDEIINERYPHGILIRRVVPGRVDAENPFSDSASLEDVESVVYDGEGRSFTYTTTEGNNYIDENKRKASIPVRYDEWDAVSKPTDGDLIRVTIGNNVEDGVVYDCESDNNRTLVYWNLRRV